MGSIALMNDPLRAEWARLLIPLINESTVEGGGHRVLLWQIVLIHILILHGENLYSQSASKNI